MPAPTIPKPPIIKYLLSALLFSFFDILLPCEVPFREKERKCVKDLGEIFPKSKLYKL
jgi:hypothetical protein